MLRLALSPGRAVRSADSTAILHHDAASPPEDHLHPAGRDRHKRQRHTATHSGARPVTGDPLRELLKDRCRSACQEGLDGDAGQDFNSQG